MELQRFKHTLAVIILLSYLVLVNSTIGVSPKDDWYTTSVYQCIRQQGFQNSTTFVIHTEDGIDED